MIKNMGGLDRIARVAAAVVVAILLLTGAIEGTLAIILAVVAAIFVLTSLMSTCPLYIPFGLSTRNKDA